MSNNSKCSLCQKEFEGPTYNGWPLSDDRVCETCYNDKVAYAKYEQMRNMRNDNLKRNHEIELKSHGIELDRH